MKKKSKIIWVLGGILGLCLICFIIAILIPNDSDKNATPSAEAISQSSGESTDTQLISEQQLPSDNPTNTLAPTLTATPTLTSTPSPTATQTLTPTPPPPGTQTAEAISDQQTQVALNTTSTAEAKNATRTQAAADLTATADMVNATRTQAAQERTATSDALNVQRTATKEAKSAQATQIAQYEQLYWKELITYPDSYTGTKVKISGQVFNVVSDQELQMYVGSYDAIYVVMDQPFTGLYEDSWIIVYGTVDGTYCFNNAFGGEVCQPLLIDAFYTIP